MPVAGSLKGDDLIIQRLQNYSLIKHLREEFILTFYYVINTIEY